MDKYEFKAFGMQLTKAPDEAGRFEGYAAVFGNEDSDGDVIDKGAFAKTLQENPQVPILWQHDPYEPIGVSVEMAEDDKGLRVVGELELEVQRAREARALMQKGALKGLSIGYRTIKYEIERTEDSRRGMLRRLKELKLGEWSPVTFPANPLAQVSAVKALSQLGFDVNDFEQDDSGAFVLRKEGRVLSGKNRQLIEQAIEALQSLLTAAEPAKATQPAQEPTPQGDAEPEAISTLRALIGDVKHAAG